MITVIIFYKNGEEKREYIEYYEVKRNFLLLKKYGDYKFINIDLIEQFLVKN